MSGPASGGDDLATRLSALTPEQRALFEALRKKKAAPKIDLKPPPIPRREPGGERWPLSFDQERLWFLYALDPQDTTFNIESITRLTGRLEVAALREAFRAVLRRHESWRTRFPSGFPDTGGEPVQVVDAPEAFTARVGLPLVDLAALPREWQDPEVRRLRVEQARSPFVLEEGPLVRAALVRLDAAVHELLLTVHHIVTDWVSFQIFWGELITLYGALVAGRGAEAASLPEPPVQYADFAVWQREWLRGEVLETYHRYWQERLAGAPLVLDLPTDRPRSAVPALDGAQISIAVDAGRHAGLKALSRREGLTLFMTLLAAYQAVLSRLSGQDTVLVGTPNANRNRPEIEPLLGYFLTQLVLRVDLDGDPTLREVLRRARESALGAYAHQELPFGKLVEALQPERDLSRPPIVQVIFQVLSGQFDTRLDLQGIELQTLEPLEKSADAEHIVSLWDEPDRLHGIWEYQTALFDRSTVERAWEDFQRILDALLEDPERRLSQVPVLSPAATHQVLIAWNERPGARVPEATLHGLAAARAARFPEEIAVAHRSGSLTRRELMARAGRVAGALRRHGVGPEVRVALCLPRTPDMIAAVLGVLEAGGAYVALDPAHPRERLEYLLADAGAAVLLTAEGMVPGLAPTDGVRLELAEVLAGTTETGTQGPEALPGNLAYLIYTSGSTGRPKGVAVEHRSVVAFVSWARDLFSPDELEGLLASSSLGFDMSVFELFTSLSWGRTLVLVDNGLDVLEDRLPEGVELTLLNTVPSMAAELARARKIPPSVRTVSLCGEPLRRGLVEDIFDRSGTRLLYNMYGPAETTVFSSFVLLTPEDRGGPGDPTLGRPIGSERIYVVNRAGDLVPVGAHGELLIGGTGLSRGYFGRPGLTAERFVPDPFGGRPGERLYRTGDLGRHRADGELEFLGRIDFQVKVRGFRVEPGEVEATLLTHPAVREAAVLAPEERPGERRLIACVAAEGAAGPELEAALAGFLRERLPEYFIPSAFLMLERLPQNANGKVDRRALASLAAGVSGGRRETLAPRTADEERLAALWSELLPAAGPVGVRDDFFALGGHSLLATRLVGRVREAFGVELPIRTVFQAPTVEGLLARIAAARREAGVEVAADEIPRVARDGDALPLSFAQERLWFLDRLTPGSAAYNVPLALRVEGDLPALARTRAAFAAVVRRHEALRTVFGEEQGTPFQRITPAPRDWPLPLVDLSALAPEAREEEAARFAVADALAPFDLGRGPLLRTTLLRLAPREHALLLAVHHIVSDAWSMGVLVADLTAMWGGWGGEADLPELPVQYADYAAWQRERLTGEELARQAAFWREQLAGAPAALDLPTDRPRPPVPSHRGGMAAVEIPGGLLRAAEELARRQGATLFMVLLAAWGVLLARLAGQRDVLVGTAAANRERPELERLIGFFINTLVMRVRLDGPAPSFGTLLDQVRQRVLDAFSHRDLPFEKLVEELQPHRDRSRAPLFQAMLVLQNAPVGAAELPGLRITPLPVASQTAKWDLTLTLAEENGRLHGHLEYAAELFDATTLERWNGAFLRLLGAAVADPSLVVTAIDLLSPEERRQLLVDWNRGRSDLTGGAPTDATLADLFAAQVARTPEAIALTTLTPRQESLTYAELADRSRRLAAALRRGGVGPEARVGVCLQRSADLVVSLLGVLQAGGACVPLDPAYPVERLAFMAADAGLAAVVVDELTAERAPAGIGAPRVLVKEALRSAPLPTLPSLSPRNLAYLIYTSGSTGRPKGVALEHRSLVSLVTWSAEIYSPEDLGGVLAATSVSFDVSVAELLVPLCRGGRLVLVANALDLVSAGLQDAGVTLASAPPSVLAELLRAGDLPGSLRVVSAGGEPLPRALADQLYEQSHVERVYNLYGPSEDTTYSTVRLVEREGRGAPSIGRPIAGSRAYVVDPEGNLAPVGVHGELLLGGEGLARGYFGRPALTAERFVPDRFSGASGGRLYRTGDLARRKADGDLDFLGRLDHQVKVRGFRVELGEIESALARHPQVREAAVVEHSGRLAAFVSLRAGSEEGGDLTGELKRWLARSLPAPMLPPVYLPLDALPLSPNGKVDRLALERLAAAAGVPAAAEYVPPRTPLEERLVEACAEILGVERVGMHDSFFDLGGHSLLATRLLALLQGRWEIELTLQDIFDSATLAALAERIVDRELERMDREDLAELMAEVAEAAKLDR